MSATRESLTQLNQTITSGWDNSAFGVEVSNNIFPDYSSALNDIGTLANSGVQQSIGYLQAAGVNLNGVLDSEQYNILADTAGSASLNYLNEKVQRIKTLWLTQKTTTVGALIGEVSPYALAPKEAGKLLVNRLKDLVAYLAGIQSGETWEDIGLNALDNFTDYLANDPSFMAAASQLQAVQAFGNVLNSAVTIIDTARRIMNIVETVLPWNEITSLFALIYWSGGTTATTGTAKISEEVEKIVQRLIAMLVRPLKKLAFGIKVKVPALLLGSMNSISVKEAVASYGPAASWLETIFSEEFYQETINTYRWETGINQALTDTLGTLNKWSQFKFDNEADRGNLLKTKFLSNLVQNYMYGTNGKGGVIAQARAAAHITDYSSNKIAWGYSNGYNTDSILASTTTPGTTNSASSASVSISSLDHILNNGADDSPITDELAIRAVSKKIYEAL